MNKITREEFEKIEEENKKLSQESKIILDRLRSNISLIEESFLIFAMERELNVSLAGYPEKGSSWKEKNPKIRTYVNDVTEMAWLAHKNAWNNAYAYCIAKLHQAKIEEVKF